ncbi:hypothetical protein XaC1_221 [Xanthomonas phage XaC1]|nr:hypothetical protein XaC1_221 [Xanthomonas phage XaC1]
MNTSTKNYVLEDCEADGPEVPAIENAKYYITEAYKFQAKNSIERYQVAYEIEELLKQLRSENKE